MKTISKTALVALMTATIGLGAIAPSFAQQAAAAAPAEQTQRDNFRQHNQGPRNGGPMGGGDFLGVERGAEAIEIALVRLSHRLELTDAQQPLFDALKTAALSAATDFATATEGLRPTPPVEGEAPAAPDFTTRLDNAITIQAARLAALEAMQPAATAFFDSLTADQVASLTPQRPEGGMPGGFGKGGPREQGGPHGQHGGPLQGGPGAPEGAPAPADAPTPPTNG